MKSTGKKSKQGQAKASESRDKARNERDNMHALGKAGKTKTPLAEKRASTRAQRRGMKEVLKDVQTKFNG